MSDLADPTFYVPLSILVMEIGFMSGLGRLHVKRKFEMAAGSYLMFVAAAFGFGLVGQDDFGFSWISLLMISEPWSLLIRLSPGPFDNKVIGFVQSIYGVAFGTIRNCAILSIIGRVNCSEHITYFAPQGAI